LSYAVALEMLEFPGIDGIDSLGIPSQNLPLLASRFTEKRNLVEGSCWVLRFFNCAGMG
jgi:hypothetical protein